MRRTRLRLRATNVRQRCGRGTRRLRGRAADRSPVHDPMRRVRPWRERLASAFASCSKAFLSRPSDADRRHLPPWRLVGHVEPGSARRIGSVIDGALRHIATKHEFQGCSVDVQCSALVEAEWSALDPRAPAADDQTPIAVVVTRCSTTVTSTGSCPGRASSRPRGSPGSRWGSTLRAGRRRGSRECNRDPQRSVARARSSGRTGTPRVVATDRPRDHAAHVIGAPGLGTPCLPGPVRSRPVPGSCPSVSRRVCAEVVGTRVQVLESLLPNHSSGADRAAIAPVTRADGVRAGASQTAPTTTDRESPRRSRGTGRAPARRGWAARGRPLRRHRQYAGLHPAG